MLPGFWHFLSVEFWPGNLISERLFLIFKMWSKIVTSGIDDNSSQVL